MSFSRASYIDIGLGNFGSVQTRLNTGWFTRNHSGFSELRMEPQPEQEPCLSENDTYCKGEWHESSLKVTPTLSAPWRWAALLETSLYHWF